mmetsp:Transcript_40390/g.128375  ORF Transcript_40390/g.128375 Transcript_40390/m.128375 type:complete len:268 (+) Transcript_40390:789-1592(+)
MHQQGAIISAEQGHRPGEVREALLVEGGQPQALDSVLAHVPEKTIRRRVAAGGHGPSHVGGSAVGERGHHTRLRGRLEQGFVAAARRGHGPQALADVALQEVVLAYPLGQGAGYSWPGPVLARGRPEGRQRAGHHGQVLGAAAVYVPGHCPRKRCETAIPSPLTGGGWQQPGESVQGSAHVGAVEDVLVLEGQGQQGLHGGRAQQLPLHQGTDCVRRAAARACSWQGCPCVGPCCPGRWARRRPPDSQHGEPIEVRSPGSAKDWAVP